MRFECLILLTEVLKKSAEVLKKSVEVLKKSVESHWKCGQDFCNDQPTKMVTQAEGIPDDWEGMD